MILFRKPPSPLSPSPPPWRGSSQQTLFHWIAPGPRGPEGRARDPVHAVPPAPASLREDTVSARPFAGMTAKKPLLHFLLMGALLFVGQRLLPETAMADTTPIRISAADLDRLRGEWLRETARRPNGAELDASVRRYGDEEILLQEALRQELDVQDPVARERLLTNMRFAFPDTRSSDDELLREAQALGMNQRDLVVRRRLVQLMEMRTASRAEINDAALRAHVTQHPQRYAQAEHLGFRQVFVKAERTHAEARAKTLLARLRQNATDVVGDSFLLGSDIPPRTRAQIARSFGEAFATALTQASRGEWVGPLRSPYGWHLVRITQELPAVPADFEKVRAQAAYALLTESEAQTLRAELKRLRRAYPLELTAVADAESPERLKAP